MNTPIRSRKAMGLPRSIRDAVDDIFRQCGLPSPYVLYRTCHWIKNPPAGARGFGESPRNLLPSQRSWSRQRGWTVYLMFGQAPPAMENLRELVAFPDHREGEFPLLKVVRLGDKKKADTSSLPSGVWFPTLAALRAELVRDRF